MKKYSKIYQQLRKKYTDEEIVDSMLIPEDLTEKEKESLAKEMREIRLKKLSQTTDNQQIVADVMRLRFQMENYIKNEPFSFSKTFGKYLKEYIRIIKKTRREIADDLSIHYTKLSRMVNDKEDPNIEFIYRLEKHTGELISASNWWKLIIKKQEHFITKDHATRKIEYLKVKNQIRA